MEANSKNNQSSADSKGMQGMFAAIVIPVALIVGWLIFKFVLGSSSNFVDGDPEKNPLPGNYLGVIYKGGIIVPILLGTLLTLITFAIERMLTISKSTGTGNMDSFLRKVKGQLASNNIDAAIAECDTQKGSVGNVVKTGLMKYKSVWNNNELDKDAKLAAIQKELEEATTLELPMLERNLVIISTVASIATLLGLLGTVVGMIKAFAALAQAGAPDAVALASGISEALINTALGIGTSALAIILYNYFTNRIDGITYRIDEAGFSISQTFASSYSEKRAATSNL